MIWGLWRAKARSIREPASPKNIGTTTATGPTRSTSVPESGLIASPAMAVRASSIVAKVIETRRTLCR